MSWHSGAHGNCNIDVFELWIVPNWFHIPYAIEGLKMPARGWAAPAGMLHGNTKKKNVKTPSHRLVARGTGHEAHAAAAPKKRHGKLLENNCAKWTWKSSSTWAAACVIKVIYVYFIATPSAPHPPHPHSHCQRSVATWARTLSSSLSQDLFWAAQLEEWKVAAARLNANCPRPFSLLPLSDLHLDAMKNSLHAAAN